MRKLLSSLFKVDENFKLDPLKTWVGTSTDHPLLRVRYITEIGVVWTVEIFVEQ